MNSTSYVKFNANSTANEFITSDLHFLHENVIHFNKRPFISVEDMTKGLLNEINSLPDGAHLFQLGDFIITSKPKHLEAILEQIKSSITLINILGNHDHRLKKVFERYGETQRLIEIKRCGVKIVMGHMPMHEWNQAQHGSLHFHGHCHGQFEAPGRTLDVCWDNRHRILPLWEAMNIASSKPIYQPCHNKNNGTIVPISLV